MRCFDQDLPFVRNIYPQFLKIQFGWGNWKFSNEIFDFAIFEITLESRKRVNSMTKRLVLFYFLIIKADFLDLLKMEFEMISS